MIGLKDEEPHKAHYTDRDLALAEFRPFRDSLANDGYLHFGMIFQHAGATEEIYVQPAKSLKLWSSQPDDIALSSHGSRFPRLRCCDSLMSSRTSRKPCHLYADTGYVCVIEEVQAAFATLPER